MSQLFVLVQAAAHIGVRALRATHYTVLCSLLLSCSEYYFIYHFLYFWLLGSFHYLFVPPKAAWSKG